MHENNLEEFLKIFQSRVREGERKRQGKRKRQREREREIERERRGGWAKSMLYMREAWVLSLVLHSPSAAPEMNSQVITEQRIAA